MPFLLAGGGGGLTGNRFRDYGGRSHNDLLSALVNLFGDARTTLGDPTFCTQPIDDLTT
jgi:hypothetical protein